MANQGNGRNVAMPDENQPSWRPQDENGRSRSRNVSMRDDDDDDRYSTRDRERMGSHWEDRSERNYGGYRSTEYGGQGQSGYGAGRYEGDQSYGSRNQSSMSGETRDRGLDERFTGSRGEGSYSQHDRDRGGSYYGQQGGMGRGGYGEQGYRSYGSEHDRGFPSGTFDNEGHYSERQQQHHRYQSNVGHYGHPGQGGYGQGFGQGGTDMGAGGYLGQGGQQMGYGNMMGGMRGHEGVPHERQQMSSQYGARGAQGHGGVYGQGGYNEGMYGQGGPQDRYGSQGVQGWGQSGHQGYGGPGGHNQGIGAAAGGWNQQGSSIGQMNEMRQMQGGQMGMHRGKGPSGYTRSDDRIKEIVCEVLTDDHHIDATHIDVSVKNGEVTLTGTVEDRQQKRRAEDVVEHLSCVRDVQNQLRVQSADKRSASAVDRSGTEQSQQTTGSSSDKRHRA